MNLLLPRGPLLLLLAGTRPPPAFAEAEAGPHWDYRVKVADDLRTLEVRVTFTGFEPKRLCMAPPSAVLASFAAA